MNDTRRMLSNRTRIAVTVVMTVVILAFVNLQIAGKERVVREGRTVLLPLAPVDPRSLLQGDYMALRYAMANEVAAAATAAEIDQGTVVVELDENDIARLVALDRGQPLGAEQQRLVFRKRGDAVRLASDAFFFEEGQGEYFAAARYGELRVAEDGTAVLVGLRDEAVTPLTTPRVGPQQVIDQSLQTP
jgi:uncharacterized membrane-anchored protein